MFFNKPTKFVKNILKKRLKCSTRKIKTLETPYPCVFADFELLGHMIGKCIVHSKKKERQIMYGKNEIKTGTLKMFNKKNQNS